MRRIIPLILISVFFSCSHKQEKEESRNLLPKDKMIQVLLDIHLTEAMMLNGSSLKNVEQMKKTAFEYEKIFKRNDVTPQKFYSTFNYYLNHPAEMDSTYKNLVELAIQKQSEMIKNAQDISSADSIASQSKNMVRKHLSRNRKNS